ncbi:LytTR family DNA-binding domain-containing protein [Paenibacillus daejeonensis]|uniref:LytTR family DNA-binding domain-containing protein n=1 Tax=Paenibacillus daejeonensis TaxID=135193 RepID=UPI00037A2A9A|nr:LytTR family DNA-binding domain-containing protein [Paenibacillus daejeonensis]
MKLHVTRDPRNLGELLTLDLKDVLYIENYERTVLLHTTSGRYYSLVPSLSTYEHHLKSYGFKRLDRTNLVNLREIESFDEQRSLVFFKNTQSAKDKFGTVSSRMMEVVRRFLKEKKK